MLRISSLEAVRTLGTFLTDSGYSVDRLGRDLGLGQSLHTNLDNLEPLLYKTSGDTRLHVLARLFFVGLPVDVKVCRQVIPDEILAGFVEAGALTQVDSQFEPQSLFIPFGNLIAACDTTKARKADFDVVVGPSLTTNLISRLTIRGTSEATLDLGTGSGILALEAAAYSKRVVATDINERAAEFANFGAALNGITNVTVVCGDAFEPIGDQRFSRIIANPPFFITPSKKLTYSDSPLELDGFCRRLAKEAPRHLEDLGFFQMICEWVQVTGQPWQDRIREWVAESGCDALVLQGTERNPADYAEKRANEAVLLDAGLDGHSFADRIAYFHERNVEKIFGGVIVMRKRTGANWVSITPADPISDSAGDAVRARFDALDFVSSRSDADLFKTKFRLASDVGLEQRRAFTAEGWQLTSSQLVKTAGLEERLHLDDVVANFLPLFDGERDTAEIAAIVSASLEISSGEAEQKCLQLVRRLMQGNFVEPV